VAFVGDREIDARFNRVVASRRHRQLIDQLESGDRIGHLGNDPGPGNNAVAIVDTWLRFEALMRARRRAFACISRIYGAPKRRYG
jgi:hypothetical protein